MIEFLIAILPLLALLGPLLSGRYPGHRVAMRLAERLCSPLTPRRPAERWHRPRLRSASQPIRGGLLIAFGLAQRPPPLAS